MNCVSYRNQLQFLVLLTVLFCFVTDFSLEAQNTTAGAIAGTVTDSTGAVVQGAQITVTNQATQQVSTASDERHRFLLSRESS